MKRKRKQYLGNVNDPQPGVVQELYPWTAMCVRNVDVHVSCSLHVDAQLAAFFIDPRAKRSTVQDNRMCIICMLYSSTWIHHTRFRRSRGPTPSTNGENEDAVVAAYTDRICRCERRYNLCSRRQDGRLRTPGRKVHLK